MKRKLVSIIMLISVIGLLYSNNLTSFTTSSPQWKASHALCVANGYLPPTSVSPMTGGEIKAALSRIPEGSLSEQERMLRDEILRSLEPDMLLQCEHINLEPSVVITPEIYTHSNAFDNQWDYIYQIKDMQELLLLGFRMDLEETGYTWSDFDFISPGLVDQYGKNFGSNADDFPVAQREGVLNAGLLLGNSCLYGGIFRTRQSMGYGKTGNLVVGDNFSRQDFARLKIFSEYLDYTLNITHFDQSKETPSKSEVDLLSNKYNGMQQNQIVHRFEAKLLDVIQFTFQEAAMFNTQAAFDLRFINPFIYFHGMNNYAQSPSYTPGEDEDEINNYSLVEIGYTAVPHLMLNLQFLMDQIQMQEERDDPEVCPQAYGALLNIQTPWILDDYKYLNAWFETAVIMPYTYLNRKEHDSKFNTNLDMITGYRNQNQQEIGYAGYKYGSDCIVNAIGVNFGKLGTYDAEAVLEYLIHGRNGYGYQTIIPPRGPEYLDDMMLEGVGFKGAEHRITLRCDGSWNVQNGIEVIGGAAVTRIINNGCVAGKNSTDVSLKLALSFSLMEMFL